MKKFDMPAFDASLMGVFIHWQVCDWPSCDKRAAFDVDPRSRHQGGSFCTRHTRRIIRKIEEAAAVPADSAGEGE